MNEKTRNVNDRRREQDLYSSLAILFLLTPRIISAAGESSDDKVRKRLFFSFFRAVILRPEEESSFRDQQEKQMFAWLTATWGKTRDERKYQRNKSELRLQMHLSVSSCSSHSDTSYSALSGIEMTLYVSELRILWLLLTLTVLLDASPARRKVSRAPIGFRYKDLDAEATSHGGTYYYCHFI